MINLDWFIDFINKEAVKRTRQVYEQRDDGWWQVSWWEGRYRYGAAGETMKDALENALKLKADGKVTAIDWLGEKPWNNGPMTQDEEV